MTLRQARILSSETDNTIKQEQNTNVNIKITKPQTQQPPQSSSFTNAHYSQQTQQPPQIHQQAEQQRPNTVPLYPNVQPLNNVNFTQANQPTVMSQAGQTIDSQPMMMNSQCQFQPQTSNIYQGICERGVTEMASDIEELDKKNKFLEMIIEMYETNPLRVNSCVVCESKLLMNMIKLLTNADKVELILNDDIGCSGCTGKDKFIYVSKILVTKDNKTEDLKYSYNEIYSQFVKFGISLKIVV